MTLINVEEVREIEGQELVHLDEPQSLQVRDLEKREIVGRIVPYGEEIQIRGRPESFAQGAFRDVDPSKVKLLRDHDRRQPLGRMTGLEERADGAYGVYKVSRTAAGDEALELASDGVLMLSGGFFPGEQTQSGVHTRVKAMPETSLVTFGAYQGSQVLAVRNKEESDMSDTDTQEVETREEAVDLTVLETRMDDVSRKLDLIEARFDAPDGQQVRAEAPKPLDWFAAQVEGIAGDSHEKRETLAEKWDNFKTSVEKGSYETRALSDITGGEAQAGDSSPADDLSGLVVEEFVASELVNVLDARRPFFASLGMFPMPRSGYAKIPTITQHAEVAARAGQKQEANSQKMISTNASFEAAWLDGALDVAFEVIAQADLPVLSLVWDDLLRAYAQATEHDTDNGVVSLVEAGTYDFEYTDAALSTNTYADFIDDVEAQVDVIDDATGEPPTRLAVTRAQWRALVAMVDANDRRLFSTIGAQNADASVGLTARSFSLPGGIEVFKVKNLTQAVLFNPNSLKAADSGPQRVEATNVAKMGRDVGILGRTMIIPRIPSGVVVYGTDPTS